MTDLAALTAANAKRFGAAKLVRGSEFASVARRLCAAKDRYLPIAAATGVPWFIIAVIHEREASQRFDRQLGQGDPLNQVSTHDPKGRGPFLSHPNDPPGQDAFYRGALDALIDCPPYAARWKDWSAGGALTLLEQYNGLGYFIGPVTKRNGVVIARYPSQASPYIWSGTDQYRSGKYVADHVFDPKTVDSQLGCAGLLIAMSAIDPGITFAGLPQSPPAPAPKPIAPTPKPAPQPAPRAPVAPAREPTALGKFLIGLFAALFRRK